MKCSVLLIALVALAGVLPTADRASAYYNPGLGRFMQRDPLGYVDGLSLYQYEQANTIRFLDAAGYDAQEDCRRTADRNAVIRQFKCNEKGRKCRSDCEAKYPKHDNGFSECLTNCTTTQSECLDGAKKANDADDANCQQNQKCDPLPCAGKATGCFEDRVTRRKKCEDDYNKNPAPPEGSQGSRSHGVVLGGVHGGGEVAKAERDDCLRDADTKLSDCLKDKGCYDK
jgi:hypothetical protein